MLQALILLLFCFVALATGQTCVKRFVGGKLKSYGNCENAAKAQSVVAGIKNKTEAEKEPEMGSCRNKNLTFAKIRNDTGGVFDIYIPNVGVTEVFCDTTTDGGDWIVFQRRMDGSVDFYRNWTNYVTGFGSRSGEFWLGLEALHELTKTGQHELRFDMVDTAGNRLYANYSSFKIGPGSGNYVLSVSGFSGNAGDGFAGFHNGSAFSTFDKNNGGSSARNCAMLYHGAWWYSACHWSNFNGQYGVRGDKGMKWYNKSKLFWATFTEMKLRQKK